MTDQTKTLAALVSTFNNRTTAERFALARQRDTWASLFRPLSDLDLECLPTASTSSFSGDDKATATRIRTEARAARALRLDIRAG